MASKGRRKPSLHDLTLELPTDVDAFLSELLGGSDRACALIAGSILDRSLVAILSIQMRTVNAKEQESIFYGQTAILGTFSSKIRMSRALPLITAQQSKHLDTIRCIRNHFAHSVASTTFEDNLISKECEILWDDTAPRLPIVSKLSIPRTKFITRWRALIGELLIIGQTLLRSSTQA